MKSWRHSSWVVIASFLTLAGSAAAQTQDGGATVDVQAAQRALQDYQRGQERLKAIEADRGAVVAEIVGRLRGATNDGGRELQRALAGASAEILVKASDAENIGDVNRALFGRGDEGPKDLGSGNSDLVFFPLTPCRLVDTRVAGGILAAGTTRDFDSNGANLSGQGGSATGCGVNDPDPSALAVTITAVNAQGAGDFRAFPTTSAPPNASVVNYGLPGQGLNLANTTILPLFQNAGNTNEFTIQADASAAHVVVDVVGYFFSPLATGLACTTVSNSVVVANNAQINFPPGLTSGACPAGFTLTGGGNQYSGAVTGWFWWNSFPSAGEWVTAGRNTTGGNVTATVFGVCCRVPGR
jgi:hypothetical protein